jgi:hypothetical protein
VRRGFLTGLSDLWRYLISGPVPGEAELVRALVKSAQELLPPDECEVKAQGSAIVITTHGRSGGKTDVLTPAFVWRTSLPVTDRLQLVFEMYGRSLQRLLTSMHGATWPAPNTELHVSVNDDAITVWWGGPSESEATVRLRPFARHELGI